MTGRRRPLLLMDVDGVLNPFPDCPEGFDEYDFFPDHDEPVRLASVHGEWLAELAETFEIAWATGWGANANRYLGPHFGLPELPVVVLPQVRFEPADKVPAIAAFAADRPAAWVDDIVTREARAWAAARSVPTLLVEVDSGVGLTRTAIVQLVAWAASLESWEDPPKRALPCGSTRLDQDERRHTGPPEPKLEHRCRGGVREVSSWIASFWLHSHSVSPS